jgi:hypothetical protein
MKKMLGDRIQHDGGRLGACGVVEKNKSVAQSGKRGTSLAYRELWHDPNNIPASFEIR